MKRYLKFEVLLPISALAMTVAITVFRSLAICLAYDPAVGYYETGNLLVISANLLTAIYVFLAFALFRLQYTNDTLLKYTPKKGICQCEFGKKLLHFYAMCRKNRLIPRSCRCKLQKVG